MPTITSFLAGLVFGIGLVISGMVYPEKVLGFLDLAGNWDPSLGLVMVGAIIAGSIAFGLARTRKQSYLGVAIKLPTARNIDRRLVIGSLLFGIGWGIAGICPGPAIVDLGTGQGKIFIFFLALLAGMFVFDFFNNPKRSK